MTAPTSTAQPNASATTLPAGSLTATQPCAQTTPVSSSPLPHWQSLSGAAAARLAVACTTLYRHAVRSADPVLYDAAAVLAALQAQDVAQRPLTPARVRAALDAARQAYRLDLGLKAPPPSG